MKLSSKLYVELYIDLNINIEAFALNEEQKEELKRHIEKWWRANQKEELVQEAEDKVFKMKLREIMEDE